MIRRAIRLGSSCLVRWISGGSSFVRSFVPPLLPRSFYHPLLSHSYLPFIWDPSIPFYSISCSNLSHFFFFLPLFSSRFHEYPHLEKRN